MTETSEVITDAWHDEGLDRAEWHTLSCIGPQFMVKFFVHHRGYSIMITDTTTIWGERCVGDDFFQNSQVWASCLEASPEDMAQLIMNDILTCRLKCVWSDNRRSLGLSFNALLGELPYSWNCCLKRLPDSVFRDHWSQPFLVSFHWLNLKIEKLKEELKALRREVDETGSTGNNVKGTTKKDQGVTVMVAVDSTLKLPLDSVLSPFIENYSTIMEALAVGSQKTTSAVAVHNDKPLPVPTKVRTGPTEEELEKERRIKLQQLVTANKNAAVKKRKVNL